MKKKKLSINNEKRIIDKKEDIVIEKKPKLLFIKDNYIFNLVLLTLVFFTVEILFKVISGFEIIDWSTLRVLLSSFIIAIIITFFSSFAKKRWIRNAINLIFAFGYTIYAWLQLGFINYLGVYISFNTSSQFGAVTDYIYDFLLSFKLTYFTIFIPFILIVICYLLIFKRKEYNKINLRKKLILVIPILLLSSLLYFGTLKIPFMQNELQIKSNIQLFKNPDVPTVAVNQFGTTVFGIIDFKSFIFPEEESVVYNSSFSEENEPVNREVSASLEEIAKNSDDKKYNDLNNYFASQKINDYNSYTGMFEGKNVVVILMESVNEAIINSEYFPNFTNLYNNGWHWENTYSPRNSCATGNNEFSALTGLYSIYNTCTANVYKNNTYFESIFNLFNNSGYTTTSMHDFVEWYYYRSVFHKNMGSGKFYGAKELGIKTAINYGEWPSDIEFFDKAFDIILNNDDGKPWMTWLTTVTSHQPYTVSSTYGDLYMKYFKELGYSTAVSRYLSKLKVLDEAIGTMIEKLKSAGELENTVIVMLADHYPYGLNKTYIKEIIDHDLSDYEIERTPFVIYNSQMQSKTFSEYNSYINLVPTIANLMNLKYDPRLYMGTDLLSDDYESLVVFADGSWKNEIAYYNASTSKIKYYTDVTYTIEELQQINKNVSLKIFMSSKAIKNNYFKYLETKIEEYNANNPSVTDNLDLDNSQN